MKFSLAILASIGAVAVTAQVPETDIYLLPIDLQGNSVKVERAVNITNRKGYDNQPSFTPDGQGVYFVSFRNNQADIFYYDRNEQKVTRLTQTPEDEYSPVYMPAEGMIHTVRVEKDSTQRLWRMNKVAPLKPYPVFPDIKGVGYYEWLNNNEAALFLVGDTFTLVLAARDKTNPVRIAAQVGRSFHKIGENELLYVSKADTLQSVLMKYDLRSGISAFVANMPEGTEDFIVYDNTLLSGSGGQLLRYDYANPKTGWHSIADLRNTTLENFYRLAISPDGTTLALVTFAGEKP